MVVQGAAEKRLCGRGKVVRQQWVRQGRQWLMPAAAETVAQGARDAGPVGARL